jgi:metal-sulfur cluster biosynthetic enzyme
LGEAWRVVARVNDPELDEPVTELGFVERIDVADDGLIELDFRLPTYWCSPNFAFLMLDDIRKALESLSWRPRFRITLHDHLFAEEVNKGISGGRSFESIFASLGPQGDVTALRETFRKKAFQKRQEAAILALRGAGWLDEETPRDSRRCSTGIAMQLLNSNQRRRNARRSCRRSYQIHCYGASRSTFARMEQ